MRRRPLLLALAVAAGLAGGPARAGEWTPRGERRFRLTIEGASRAEATPADRRWQQALVTKLKKAGRWRFEETFVRSGARLFLNDRDMRGEVFASEGGGRRFVAIADPYVFLVDFDAKKITVSEPRAVSFYRSPSRNVLLVVNGVPGIPVVGPPGDPQLTETAASWY